MSTLQELAADLERAASSGGTHAGEAAVSAGTERAEIGLRTPGSTTGFVAVGHGLSARIAGTQRRGVFQEAAPATAKGVNTAAVADTMAEVAAAAGAKAVHS